MATSNTVVALKSAFLRTQTRILSQPLQPEDSWTDGQRELDGEAVREVIREVNRQIRRHTRTVYPISSMRHIAEQIDKLYWDAGAPDLEVTDKHEQEDDTTLTQGDDLTLYPNLTKLPPIWSEGSQAEKSECEALFARLTAVSEDREIVAQKLAQYKSMQDLIEPFKNPAETIQPNLVTRDGPLADELAKMRSLSVRLSARIGVMQRDTAGAREDDEDVLEIGNDGDKVRNLINSM